METELTVYYSNSYWTNSFREVLQQWNHRGLVKTAPYVDPRQTTDRLYDHVWLVDSRSGKQFLLYDHDLVNIPRRPSVEEIVGQDKSKVVLFGNETPQNSVPYTWRKWGYWPANPTLLESFIENSDLETKTNKICFYGSIGDRKQESNRWAYFSETDVSLKIRGIQFRNSSLFRPNSITPLDPSEYLRQVSKCKFGLSLPGLGKLCMREVEYAALKVVPILTPGCSGDFLVPWKEGENYLYARNVDEINDIVESTPESTIKRIRETNFKWYNFNCTINALWIHTHRIISEFLA